MNLIINNIPLVTFLMMMLGFTAHHLFLLSKISKKKDRIVSPLWYVRNRPYQFAGSWLMSLIGTFIAFIGYDPSTATGPMLAVYLTNIVGIGLGSDWLSDKAGRFQQQQIKQRSEPEPDDDDGDDFKTMRLDK